MKSFIKHGGSIKRPIKGIRKMIWESRFAWVKHNIYLTHNNLISKSLIVQPIYQKRNHSNINQYN
ncbi:hypothetical protein MNBD_IGNAVI01-3103 [hydrothermal vent metagenome]|uniref:Uncharacterized protein n=1 Tax=hydrothermal vent metagenome TaxID=652676 RepID=A0A3B1C321_9ZZZZ